MARSPKRWEEQPPSWRAKHAAQGWTKKRYNAWFDLSDETKKKTKQSDYAEGLTVRESSRAEYERKAMAKIVRASNNNANKVAVKHRVERMTLEQVRWTSMATLEQIRSRASHAYVGSLKGKNPWWYR